MSSTHIGIKSPLAIVSSGVSNVILASAGQFKLESRRIYDLHEPGNLGLLTIRQGLIEAGFRNVSIFEPPADGVHDIEKSRRRIVAQFKRMGAAERGAVIGLSTTTSEYFKFEPLARLIKEAFPDALLVAGGAHFFRDRIEGMPDTLETALMSGLADAVQVGHAQAFIDFVVTHDGDLEKADGHGFYRIDKASGKIVGSGIGRYPELHSLPVDYDPEQSYASTLLKNSCVHGCAYCCARLGAVPRFPADLAIESLNRFFSSNVVRVLKMVDSDPFQESDMEYYEHIINSLRNRKPLYISTYLNPILLLDGNRQERLLDLFFPGPVHQFFVGRDTALANIAAKVGSNDHGRPKTRGQLDEEQLALMEFIAEIKRRYQIGESKVQTSVIVSYLITPFETMSSFMTMADHMTYLLELNGGGVNIEIMLSPLMPFPGTRLRRKYKDSIDMTAFDFSNTNRGGVVPWKMGPDVTEFGMRLMRKIEQLYLEGKERIGSYVYRLASGEIEVDGSERRGRRGGGPSYHGPLTYHAPWMGMMPAMQAGALAVTTAVPFMPFTGINFTTPVVPF